jgi:hypothetical protein
MFTLVKLFECDDAPELLELQKCAAATVCTVFLIESPLCWLAASGACVSYRTTHLST